MKRNAIIRIILWSLVIVLLSSILVVFLGMRYGFLPDIIISSSPAASEAAVPVTEPLRPANMSLSGYVTDPLNVRASPSVDASTVGMLDVGTSVEIARQENVSGIDWVYITSPEAGWIQKQYIAYTDAMEDPKTETAAMQAFDIKTTFSASEISELEIEWVAGEILIQPGKSDQITVKEDGITDPKYAMVLKQTGDTLKILFCDEGIGTYFGINTRSDVIKDLTITVPQDWICESLEINAASATLEVNDLTIREVDFDGASGKCEFENCTVGEIDIDTASGDVRFIGELDILDCDAASASIYAVLNNTPSRLDMDTMSGDLEISLPQDTGFSLALDTMNGDFTSDFDTTMKNGNYVFGDGRCRINIDALSGDVIIRKGDDTAAPAMP